MAVIKTIKNLLGETIYPITKAKAVYTENNTTVEDKLNSISNPNLFINGGYQIWQNGEDIIATGDKYIADMWKLTGGGQGGYKAYDDVINDYCMVIRKYSDLRIVTNLEDVNLYNNKTMTFSCWLKSEELNGNAALNVRFYSDGAIKKQTTLETKQIDKIGNWIKYALTFKLTDNENIYDEKNSYVTFIIMPPNYTTLTSDIWIAQSKLEYGNIVTPFIHSNKDIELLKCQRYTYVIPYDSCYIASSGTNNKTAYMVVPTPIELRINPTIIGTKITIRGDGIINTATTGVTIYKKFSNSVTLLLSLPDGFSSFKVYFAFTTEKIILDANIY